jgi:hypothetical protein
MLCLLFTTNFYIATTRTTVFFFFYCVCFINNNNNNNNLNISLYTYTYIYDKNYYLQRFGGYRWRGVGSLFGVPEDAENQSPPWDLLYERAVNVIEQFDAVIHITVLDSLISSRYFNLDIFFRYS